MQMLSSFAEKILVRLFWVFWILHFKLLEMPYFSLAKYCMILQVSTWCLFVLTLIPNIIVITVWAKNQLNLVESIRIPNWFD